MPTPLQNINAEKIQGNLSINSVSATTYYNLPSFTGGTVPGATNFTNGLTATTISATTYYNLPSFTGGTVSGATNFTNGLTANTFSATSINKVDYIVFNTGTTSATTVAGTVYFDNTEKALSYNTSINQGVTVNLGQQNYIRVFNNTGVDIPRGKALELLSTYSGLPSVSLAINKHDGFNIIGVSSEIIPNNSEGIAITYGIISDIELTGMTVGSLIYASDNVAGKLDDATKYLNFPLTARTNEIGFVVQTGATTGKLFVAINNENSVLSLTDLERNVLEGNTLSTGVFEYTGMTKASSTTFNIASLKGWVVNNTYQNSLRPNVKAISYSGVTGQTTPYLLTDVATYVLINSASTLTLINTFPTPQQRRENIFLGRVAHPDKSTIVTVNNTVDYDVSPMSSLRDLWTPLKLINENVVVSPNGANLNFNTSSGTLWGNGIGWAENQLNPNSLSITGSTPTTFQYRVQTGGTYSDTTTIDPAYYDLNGVRTLVGGGTNSSTNQRIYLYPNRQYRVQYGQKVYSSLADAIVGVQTEAFVTFVNNRDNAILVGILSVNKNATSLNNTGEAVITFVSKFGELLGGTGGISTTTLQQAYNNSSQPEIVINSTLDGISIKNGTGNADNVTRLLEGLNTAGNATSFIRADGDISGTTIQTGGFTANTSGLSATTVNIRTIGSGTPITNLGVDINGNVVSGTTGGSTFTGGTVTGPTNFTNGLTANTISATTYYNLPIDVYSTGGTYNGGNVYITNNTGGTFTITGLTASGFSANYYGSFSDTTTQPILSANTPIAWTYNTTELSNGISVVNNSRIKVANKGVYEIGYSAQIQRLVGGTPADVTIWAKINGNDVVRTSSTLGFANNNTYQLPFVSFMFEMEANDYVEFYFSSPDTNIQITTLSGLTSPTRPVAPSVIIVAKQIGLSVTDNLSGYYLPLSGGTVTGGTQYTSGLTANTISATTYLNLPIDVYTTGGTYSSGSATFTNITGGTFSVSGFNTGDTTLYWYSENATPPLVTPIATGAGSIALGDNAKALSDNMFVYGTDTGYQNTGSSYSILIGQRAGSGATNSAHSNFIGRSAGRDASNSSFSNFMGYFAASGATGSPNSNFIGYYAGSGATNASHNNFLGSSAGRGAFNTTYSNFHGSSAGKDANDSIYSNFIGPSAGYGASYTTGSTFIGYAAGYLNTGSSYSNFLGYNTGNNSYDTIYSNLIGFNAGTSSTGSTYSNFIGYQAGYISSGNNNSNFIGFNSGYLSTNNLYSNFIGREAGSLSSGNTYANFFGYTAGYNSSGNTYGNFIGRGAGLSATTSNNSNFIGLYAGRSSNSLTYSNAIGNNAGYEASGSTFANFIGNDAGYQSSGNSYSNFIGYRAGRTSITSNNSNFIGNNAGYLASGGPNSNFIGVNAGLQSNNNSSANFIGNSAGWLSQDNLNGTFIGTNAGRNASGSTYSNFIGYQAGYNSTGNTYSNFIGNQAGQDVTNSLHTNFIGNSAGNGASGTTYSNFIGYTAGSNAIDSYNSNFLGYSAGNNASNTIFSNFIGHSAGYLTSGNSYSNFFGYAAGTSSTDNTYGNFIGRGAGLSARTSNNSNFIGLYAGRRSNSLTYSNAIGNNAGYEASGSEYVNFIGGDAGYQSSGNSYSNFIGSDAGYQSSGNSYSNFIGYFTGYQSSNSDKSNFIGQQAGQYASNATRSNFIGYLAGHSASGATRSNFFGSGVGQSATTASYSNLFGFSVGTTFAGNNIGSNNIIIGSNITLPNARANGINLGGVLFGINTYATLTGNPFTGATSTGKIGINVVTPTEALHVSGNTLINGNLTATTISATTISATTYQNLPTDIRVTGASYSNNTFTYTNNTGGTFNTLFNTVTGLTVNGNLSVTGNTSMTGTLSVTGNTNVRAITGTSATISGSGSSILTVIGSGTTTPIFSIQGSSGELFSVTDSLTGSLFSVNDISGLPIVEVFSDNTILMGNYLAPSLNTTARITLTAGTNTIYSIPTSAYTGAFVDYTVINSVNTSARAGNIMTIWNTGSTQYSEVSTNDIGSTTGITFSTSLSGSNALISASATTAGWTLKTIIRAI